MPTSAYSHPVEVRWGHCDPAGIVYFPRFFDMFHEAMEAWFDGPLGAPYREVILRRQLGFPSVHTEADFRKPTQFGERVEVQLRLGAIGNSSITLSYAIHGPGGPADLRATGKTVCAVMDLNPQSATFQRAVALPADLREAMEQFSEG